MKKQSGQRNGSSSPFLDKFLGRSTKIGLQGISGVIAEARTLVMRESDLRNRIPSVPRSSTNQRPPKLQERKMNLSTSIRESENQLQHSLISSRSGLCSNCRQSLSYSSLARESTQSEREEDTSDLRPRMPEQTELKRSRAVAGRKEQHPRYLYEGLLTGDAKREFQLMTVIQQRVRSKK